MQAIEKWGVTRVLVTKCNYSWTIQNFSYLRRKTGEELESPCFSIGKNSDAKWCLRLYLQGINENYKDFLSVYLYRKSGTEHQLDGKYTLSVLTNDGTKFMEESEECQYNKNYSSWGFPSFIKNELIRDNSLNLLVNDSLKLQCEVAIVTGIDEVSSDDTPQTRDNVAQNVLSHFEQLFLDQRLGDVKLSAACGRALHAHKSILTARSPIFAAMFEHDTMERQQNAVDIKDVEFNVLKEMLRFIYADRIEITDKSTSDLLIAADKYQIEGLKEHCVQLLSDNISVENVAEVLVIADRHNVASLKTRAMNFIRAHIAEVVDTSGFESIVQVHVLAEIIKTLGQR
ncbi:speckle-type POZ protein-like [Phymastichus coffea]|uniref:speckle-type POZ protein-like n=1 Tax=Phymastichus coffea TaxID=108790 RepID=UPI00273B2D9A|nr:speckle-type POZ protein-like [Phymastichus coffea]